MDGKEGEEENDSRSIIDDVKRGGHKRTKHLARYERIEVRSVVSGSCRTGGHHVRMTVRC